MGKKNDRELLLEHINSVLDAYIAMVAQEQGQGATEKDAQEQEEARAAGFVNRFYQIVDYRP